MNSYETAPATILVAVNCACCSRPLVDAVSVETGVGPECRKRHGFKSAQSDMIAEEAWALLLDLPSARKAIIEGDARQAANVVTFHIAAKQEGAEVSRWVEALSLLGFTKMADRIAKRIGVIEIEVDGTNLFVKSAFNEKFLMTVRSVPGQWFDRTKKVRVVPVKSESQLRVALQKAFRAGTLLRMGSSIAVL